MKALWECDTLQISVTSACVLECANCTHLVGHARRPHMMTLDQFKRTVDSLAGYPRMIGIIGGEPLLVNWAVEGFRYLRSKFPREQLGLWSVFPEGEKFVKMREVICETFGNILLNDHAVPTIMHAPMLVAAGEYYETEKDLEAAAWNCWVQNHWSPSITAKGGFFCEVAAELDHLFEGPGGWDISEPKWWLKTPIDYADQVRRSCSKCGGCLPLERRSSQDNRCDISEGNFELLKGKSAKVDHGQVVVHKKGAFKFDQKMIDERTGVSRYPDQNPYKDETYRKRIAAKYGIALVMNERGYWSPVLMESLPKEQPSLYQILNAKYPVEKGGVSA
jgi:hypothetical protein